MRNNTFSQIASVAPPRWKRNAFDLSHYKRMSCNIGELVPTLVLDCVPGDSFRISQEALTRFAPMLSPVYEIFEMFTHFFKIPNYMVMRQDQDNGYGGWEDFLTNDPEGEFTYTDLAYLEITDARKAMFYEGTLADYLGYPVTSSGVTIHANAQIYVNLLRVLSYNLVFDEYYRDQNLQEAVDETHADVYTGGDKSGIYTTLFRTRPKPVSWEKDYFTSALPYAHDPNNTSVEYDLDLIVDYPANATEIRHRTTGNLETGSPTSLDVDTSGDVEISGGNTVVVDVTSHTNATLEIMELRRTEALFRWYEAQNRGGHRYEEHMLAVYGVQVKRARNTPIYLGGYRQKIQISEVLSTAETFDNAASPGESITTPFGDFAGYSKTYANMKGITTYCDEHCTILGLTMIRPRSTYIQGVDRHVSRIDREDFFIPFLQGVGDQAILNKELYWDQPDTTVGLPDATFGYAPNYSRYKFEFNTIHGEMRSSLNFWHCARTFTDTPSLNETFIQMNYSSTDFHRIFVNTTTSDDKIWMWINNYVQAIRPMRKYDYGQ